MNINDFRGIHLGIRVSLSISISINLLFSGVSSLSPPNVSVKNHPTTETKKPKNQSSTENAGTVLFFWFFGSLVLWFFGFLFFWFSGSLVFWFFGSLVFWFFVFFWFLGFD